MEQFPVHAETLAKELGFTADCFTNREARPQTGEGYRKAHCHSARNEFSASASKFLGARNQPRPVLNAGNRELTLAERQQLRALGETMVEQALGPDWRSQ
jgi:hypothetical protein